MVACEKNTDGSLTAVDRRPCEEAVMRLAHILLDVAAHELPSLASKKNKADVRAVHTRREHQSQTHPAPDALLEAFVRKQPRDALHVTELLTLASFVRHHHLGAAVRTAHANGHTERRAGAIRPHVRSIVTKRSDVPRHLQQRVVRDVRSEKRPRRCALRPLTLSELSNQTDLVCERLRERPAVAVGADDPGVALRP